MPESAQNKRAGFSRPLQSPSGLPAADQPMIVFGAQVATAKTAKTATQ
jgi:hypothetical protein